MQTIPNAQDKTPSVIRPSVIPPTPLPADAMEKYSAATTLTALELEIFPELAQAQWLANMMSPALWQWEDELPKRRGGSPIRRRVEAIKQYIIHHYQFTHFEEYPGLCPWGVSQVDTEAARFPEVPHKQQVFREVKDIFVDGGSSALAQLLGVSDIRRHYKLTELPNGTIPLWGNEIIDKMDAFRYLFHNDQGAGKCEALAVLYAAALVVLGRFPWQAVTLWFTPSHVMTYFTGQEGYLASNKRMFSAASLQNLNEHTAVIKDCLGKEAVRKVQTLFGSIHALLDTYSLPFQELKVVYSHLENYGQLGGLTQFGVWPEVIGKRYEPIAYPMLEMSEIENAAAMQSVVFHHAREFPGSLYDIASYAFRSLHVPHPEVYAYTARHHSRHLAALSTKLPNEQAILAYLGRLPDTPIFNTLDRIALPDEVIVFERGSHRDKALLLYALLAQQNPGTPEPLLVFGPQASYVVHEGRWIALPPGAPATRGETTMTFNSQGASHKGSAK